VERVSGQKYRDMAMDDLLATAGVSLGDMNEILRVLGALEALGAHRGLESAVRGICAAHADVLSTFHVQVGDRVRVRPEAIAAEASRWKNSAHASTMKTFSEDGTVEAVTFNSWYGYWSAVVRFDREYWKHYQTGEYMDVDRRHVWDLSLDAVEPLNREGGRHER
jgi:hypothetical protein